MTGTRFSVEVQPQIPTRLSRLPELANDLLYTWDRSIRWLFIRLDRELWSACGHNPKVFLRRISQQRLQAAVEDRLFMEDYFRALAAYDAYHQDKPTKIVQQHLDPQRDLVAYFCAEFGFHESLPIYSGGLGILAGDHCKAASDLNIPFVAVGMLYRQGYFTQTIDEHGNQIAHYTRSNFDDLPITPARNGTGEETHVEVDLLGRKVVLKVWEARAGRIKLYLLDSDLSVNTEFDRSITHQLYGGNIETRIQQEIVLGIGGVRALRALNIQPTIWHINEGHSAFQILERCREVVQKNQLDFDSALELVASGTVFTTHTPVPAGHDIFDFGLMGTYFSDFMHQAGINMDAFLRLGASPHNPRGFNMTALALRGSRFRNGVSRIHGDMASKMEGYVWPQIPQQENPIGYVTNGVHVPTFLAREWVNLLDLRFGGEWRNELLNDNYWERIDEIADHSYWSLRQTLKSNLLEEIRRRVVRQHRRNKTSEAQIEDIARYLSPKETDVLILGFARRFATYKRATLLFSDPTRLARLLTKSDRPVLLFFAGKAHPHDQPGKQLIQIIHEFCRRPEFQGHVFLLEGYDLGMARKLVAGVDVWLNTPEYPLEASGTSGQKAAINGVINLSVLDGWWGEGYDGENGWAITPHSPHQDVAYRNREEAKALLDILEFQIIPLYYERHGHGYPEGWVKKSKASMKSMMPCFNSQRMVMDYVRNYYSPASKYHSNLASDEGSPARDLATWKIKVAHSWPKIAIRRIDTINQQIFAGETLPIEVSVQLDKLNPNDVIVECLAGSEDDHGNFIAKYCYPLTVKNHHLNEAIYAIDFRPDLPGLQFYKIRAYPYHPLLGHLFEMGCMVWV